MTPWRFWFPPSDTGAAPLPGGSASPWSPQGIARSQREMWHHTAEMTEAWWRYWRSLWPSVPVQPPAGVVTPPVPAEPAGPRAAEAEPAAVPPPRRAHRPGTRPTLEAAGAQPAQTPRSAAPTKRARPVARGK